MDGKRRGDNTSLEWMYNGIIYMFDFDVAEKVIGKEIKV